MGEPIFDGIKVADFTTAVAGPLVTRFLAGQGAEVIKVESHGHPDSVRFVGPYKDMVSGADRSTQFAFYNYSKKSIALNLGRSRGREAARRLIAWCDILVENMAPGAMAEWELDYENCRKMKPDIIYLSSSSLGRTGPLSGYAAWGYHHSPLVGVSHLIGWPDRLPCGDPIAYMDSVAPAFSIIALVGALISRRKTGKGAYIDQSQAEAGAYFLGPAVMEYTVNGGIANRQGNRDPDMAPHGVFPCRGEERWVAIAVPGEKAWESFCRLVGKEEWLTDGRFATPAARKSHEEELEARVSEWTVQRTPEEAMALLQAAGVPAGVVANARDLLNDPQLKHREHFGELEHEEIGTYTYERPAMHFSKAPFPPQRPSPLIGEHTEYVLGELLGYTDDEIADLLIDGVITTDDDLPGTVSY